ncbi:MAG: hypothetical protein KDD70_04835 [Bdellovibrionales bacterium]|nr:hypothetical protein [Bdellovibrionales bacterium]
MESFDLVVHNLKSELDEMLQIHGLNSGERGIPFSTLARASHFLDELRMWGIDALSRAHLVEVCAQLHGQLGLTVEQMGSIGIPADLLEFFPGWRDGVSDGFAPRRPGYQLTTSAAGCPMSVLRLQLSPFSVTVSAALLLLKRLLECLDEDVHFHVAIEPEGNVEEFESIVSTFHSSANNRVQFFRLRTASIFAQDNARGIIAQDGNPAILLPRGFRASRARANDELHAQKSDLLFGFTPYVSQLYWEGGNILSDGHNIFVGADAITENMVRLGLTEAEVRQLFCAEFDGALHFLGRVHRDHFISSDKQIGNTGQASFHLDLDLSLLGAVGDDGGRKALLASPELGLQVADEVLNEKRMVAEHYLSERDAAVKIRSDYREYADRRLPALQEYRELLQSLEYEVVEVPDLRMDPSRNLFSTRNLDLNYCNILPGLVKGVPSIVYLPYGLPVIDQLASSAYRKAGCHPVPLSQFGRLANLLMLFRGGLRCSCSQVY